MSREHGRRTWTTQSTALGSRYMAEAVNNDGLDKNGWPRADMESLDGTIPNAAQRPHLSASAAAQGWRRAGERSPGLARQAESDGSR